MALPSLWRRASNLRTESGRLQAFFFQLETPGRTQCALARFFAVFQTIFAMASFGLELAREHKR